MGRVKLRSVNYVYDFSSASAEKARSVGSIVEQIANGKQDVSWFVATKKAKSKKARYVDKEQRKGWFVGKSGCGVN